MKKQFVDVIKAGDFVDDVFVLSEKTLLQKKDGNNFLNVSLSDKSGSIQGVLWDNVDQITSRASVGDFVYIKGSVSEYRGASQLVIRDMSKCPIESIDPSDFLPATSRDTDKMFERILQIADSVKTWYLKKLLEEFLKDEEFVCKFKTAPAAKKMHHAYIGGLLEHSLSMALLTDKIAGHYSGIDRDLLLVGIILHDIGKIREFDYTTRIDYSDEGRLLGHIVIGIQMIDEKLVKIENFPEEQAVLLKHLIASHHGTREFGSPEPPKTIEAVLLNYIDEIDSKIKGIKDFIAAENPNETWTSYHKLLGRYFYMGKNESM